MLEEEYAKVGGGTGDRFAYDGYHRLTEAWMGVLDATVMAASTNPSGWVSGQVHSYLTYDLDDANNRSETKVLDAGGTATTDYDLQGGSHPQGPSNRYDAVGPLGGALTPYEYDGRGNLIRDGVFVFRYDYLNRLQEVWKIRVDGDDDTEQYALVQEGADEEARQEVKLEVPDLMQRLPREHMNPTFRARLRAQITGGVIRLRGTGQGGGGMPSFTTPAQADLHAVYAYDAYNRRIMGIVVGVDTQFHTWDGWRQVVQYSLDTAPSPDAAVPTKQFVWGSRLDELLSYRRKNGSTWENYFVLHGGQDTAAKLVNSSGAVVEQYEYDPYGKVSVYVGSSTTAVATSSVGLPFLWKGVRLDSETGLLYMRNRYYSSATGKFISPDPLGVWADSFNGGNPYCYAGLRHLVIGDPLGLQSEATLTIYSDGNNDVSGGSHAGVIYKDANGSETTYALWPDNHELAGNNGNKSDIRKDLKGGMMHIGFGRYVFCEGDTAAKEGRVYVYRHEVVLTAAQERIFLDAVQRNVVWDYTHNCASWASDTFYEVTGIDVDADTWSGIETPGELGSSIYELNGGKSSNDGRGAEQGRGGGTSSNGKDVLAGTSVGSIGAGGAMVGLAAAPSVGSAGAGVGSGGAALGSAGSLGLRLQPPR